MLIALELGISSFAQDAGTHGGSVIHKDHADFEVVPQPDQKGIDVYATGNGYFPQSLVLNLKRDDEVVDRVYLSLTERTPERAYYNGIVQSNILVSGGITFELDDEGR